MGEFLPFYFTLNVGKGVWRGERKLAKPRWEENPTKLWEWVECSCPLISPAGIQGEATAQRAARGGAGTKLDPWTPQKVNAGPQKGWVGRVSECQGKQALH